jgi:hypothetical protein
MMGRDLVAGPHLHQHFLKIPTRQEIEPVTGFITQKKPAAELPESHAKEERAGQA